MEQAEKGRQYQDTVFRAYMNDADRLRDVAGALHGKTYAANEEIQIMTLEGTFLSHKSRHALLSRERHHERFSGST